MVQVNVNGRFPRMRPVKSPPAMFRINGCGVALYGSRDQDAETGTYVATWCLALVFIPVLALRAYRVARSPRGGWYFVGREPLSALAKGWNLLVVAGIAAGIAVAQYGNYTSTPAYKAKQQMAAARAQVEKGQLAQAAKTYQGLAVAGGEQADEAGAALGGLLDNECRQAPLREAAGVYAAAAQAARRRQKPAPADVADKAVKLVADRGDADPAGGAAVLDAVRPLVLDTRPVDARRLALLRKWAAAEPSNLDAVTPLASLLEQEGSKPSVDEAKKLLTPLKAKLADGEGARVLGAILGRDGDYDGAYALLWPYVKVRLDRLHAAEKGWEDTLNRLEERELQLLKNDKGPRDFYTRYEAAGPGAQRAMVREYVNDKIKNDPDYAAAQEALEREAGVVPVALELGIVMLQRAQNQPDQAARKAQLESAEQVFLAVRGVAGETDEYRLSLGEVYYWLGKQAEGRKLFDDFLAAKARAFKPVLQIASRLRGLGAEVEARALAEEAYGKASGSAEQYAAAHLRAMCDKDTDDKIEWLKKSNTADPEVKAWLGKTLGDQALEAGRDQEAAAQYRQAADAYAAMPRTAGTVNDTALTYYGLYQATGDRDALTRSLDYLQQAVDLSPSDSILLFNAGATMLDGALTDVIGGDIDLRALHDSGDIGLLGHLYHDQAGRDAVMKRVKDHPGVARAVSLLEKVTVLAPKNGRAFRLLDGVYSFTRDEAALRSLERRLRAADLDRSEGLQRTKEFISGSRDAQDVPKVKAALKRVEDLAAAVVPAGGRTAAVALDRQVDSLMSVEVFEHSADLDKAVKLAEDARRLSTSSRTGGTLSATYVYRAARDLRRADGAFDAYCKRYERSVGIPQLMAAVAAGDGGGDGDAFRAAVLANADFRRAVALVRDENAQYPEGGTPYEWAMLKNADPAAADRIAGNLRKTPRKQVEESIASLLSPSSGGEALEVYWLMQVLGKPDDGRAAVRTVADQGIPLPVRP